MCIRDSFFTVELLFSSILFALLPFLMIELLLGPKEILMLGVPFFGINVTLAGIVMTILVLDYITTMIVAAIERKPMLLIYGPGFFILRYIETWVFLYALVMGLFKKPSAEGKWKSPKRMAYSKS